MLYEFCIIWYKGNMVCLDEGLYGFSFFLDFVMIFWFLSINVIYRWRWFLFSVDKKMWSWIYLIVRKNNLLKY